MGWGIIDPLSHIKFDIYFYVMNAKKFIISQIIIYCLLHVDMRIDRV